MGAADVVNYRDDAGVGQAACARLPAGAASIASSRSAGRARSISRCARWPSAARSPPSVSLGTENPGIDFFALKLTSATFRNITVGDRAGCWGLVAWWRRRLKPVVDRVFAFDEAREAFAYLENGAHFGKVVIRVV